MYKILTAQQVRAADAATIEHEPISSLDLMERAAKACFDRITQLDFVTRDCLINLICGVGNNGGDGLVIARYLLQEGYSPNIYICHFSSKPSRDFLANRKRLEGTVASITDINDESEIPRFEGSSIVIDAIFGTGLSRPVQGLSGSLIEAINQSEAAVISIDVPSGLFTEDNGENNGAIVQADFTYVFEVPRLVFMLPDGAKYVGAWQVVPIGLDRTFMENTDYLAGYLDIHDIQNILKRRDKFTHKGTYGHALLLAGSYGKMGAAVLAAKACLRTGAGLLTIYVPQCGYSIIQTSLPEAMALVDEEEYFLTKLPSKLEYHAIGVGPGLGREEATAGMLKQLIQNSGAPLVLDADALNIISENKTWLHFLPEGSVMTPHPKEFERLAGPFKNSYDRHAKLTEFAKKYNVCVVLKGANSTIASADGDVYFNSTGNPGMATAGSGDVLTGIITGLLAQGYSSKFAAVIGVYLHGLAGDIAAEKLSQESLIAGDIIEHLGDGFKVLYLK